MRKSIVKFSLGISIVLSIVSCVQEPNAQELIDKTIEVAGGDAYSGSLIEFDFRKVHYKGRKNADGFKMSRLFYKDTSKVYDAMTADVFIRTINDVNVSLEDSTISKYRNSINSVFYFALLPFGLNDAAVQKKYLDQVTIHEKEYYKIEVTFMQEGGGVDFEDVYVYWINTETNKIDFLAYSFEVNGGGLRFREAYNERYVNGIRFVDYVNYKVDPNQTDVYGLDKQYQENQLEEISRIELEEINVQLTNS